MFSSLLLLKWLALAGTPAFDAGCHATLHLLIPTTHFAFASHASLTVSPRMLSHSACGGMLRFACWAEARIKIARMTLTIKLDRNWSSFQLANSAPPLSVTDSAIAPSARMLFKALMQNTLNHGSATERFLRNLLPDDSPLALV